MGFIFNIAINFNIYYAGRGPGSKAKISAGF